MELNIEKIKIPDPDNEKKKIMEEHIKNNEKKKIIIVGAKDKVSPEMLANIQEHFDCEIEILSQEEYEKTHLAEFAEIAMKKELEKIEEELKRLELMDCSPLSLIEDEKIKPEFPKTMGKVNNKKLSPLQKQHYKQRKGR